MNELTFLPEKLLPYSLFVKDGNDEANYREELEKLKIGHIRADYDGSKWWNTIWPNSQQLVTPERAIEIDKMYNALISNDCFPTLKELNAFCHSHTEALENKEFDDVYNFYYEGERCMFRVRLITRKGDYNLYLYAYVKPQGGNKI